MPPAVSVLMLAYNRPQFMRQAIESVLNQTFRDFEFLILDNGSTGDEVFNIAKEYADKDSRVQVSRVADNLGVHLGRNKLLNQAQAEYVATIEDDDFWTLDKLETQVEFMRSHPDMGLFSCSSIIVDLEGQPIGERLYHESIWPPTRAIKDMTLIRNHFGGSGPIFRRNALTAIGGWRSYFVVCDDNDLFFRMQEKFTYASTSKTLINYRIHYKNPTKIKGAPTQLSSHKDTFLYEIATRISTVYRRNQKLDPIDTNPVLKDLVAKDFFLLVETFGRDDWHTMSRRLVRRLIRERDYLPLNQFMKNYGNSPDRRIKLYFKMWGYSLKYGRLGWLWAR